MRAATLGLILSLTLGNSLAFSVLAADIPAENADAGSDVSLLAAEPPPGNVGAGSNAATGYTIDEKDAVDNNPSPSSSGGAPPASSGESSSSISDNVELAEPSDTKATSTELRLSTPVSTKTGFWSWITSLLTRKHRSKGWDRVETIPQDVSGLMKELRRAAKKVRALPAAQEVLLTHSAPRVPAFFNPLTASDQALVQFAASAQLTTDAGLAASVGSHASGSSALPVEVALRSAFDNKLRAVKLLGVMSERPLLFNVLVNDEIGVLKALRADVEIGELAAEVAAEVNRAHSFKLASATFGLVTGSELADRFGWHLLLEICNFDQQEDVIVLPGGFEVVNYFVLLKRMCGDMAKFAEAAARLQDVDPALVYAARAAVSVQILRMMSLYAKRGLYFANLSLASFAFDGQGRVYLTTVAPWYTTDRAYTVINEQKGYYKPVKQKQGGESDEAVVLHVQMNAPAIADIVISVWCMKEQQGAAQVRAPTAEDVRHRLSTVGECLPAPVGKLLGRLLDEEESARLSLTEITESAFWTQIEMLREAAS